MGKFALVFAKLDAISEKVDGIRADNRATLANLWVACAIIVAVVVGMGALALTVAQSRAMFALSAKS